MGVDDVEAQALVEDALLHFARELRPDLVGAVGRVEQEDAARRGALEDVEAVEEARLVAGDEARLAR